MEDSSWKEVIEIRYGKGYELYPFRDDEKAKIAVYRTTHRNLILELHRLADLGDFTLTIKGR